MVRSVKIQWNKMPQTLNLGKVKAILAVIVIKLVTFKISNLRWDASHNKKLNNDETDFYCSPTFLLKFRSVCFFFLVALKNWTFYYLDLLSQNGAWFSGQETFYPHWKGLYKKLSNNIICIRKTSVSESEIIHNIKSHINVPIADSFYLLGRIECTRYRVFMLYNEFQKHMSDSSSWIWDWYLEPSTVGWNIFPSSQPESLKNLFLYKVASRIAQYCP